ncbi:MAG: rhomboid family intramembrane serine protease [Alphaproteobacteria bacterium]
MFVPIHDKNPLKSIHFQYVTAGLIVLNTAIYLVFVTNLFLSVQEYLVDYSLIPVQFLGGLKLPSSGAGWPEDPLPMPEQFTIVSYMFVHGGPMHLLGNMLFLWVFGDNVEDAMGHFRFLLFYLMCGIFAGLLHSLIMNSSDIPLIGASGSVAGIVAAYLMLHPKVKIWVLVLWRIPLKISAMWALGFWVLLQLFSALTSSGEGVAWWAHVGGLTAGAVLITFMRRPGVRLFDQTQGGA